MRFLLFIILILVLIAALPTWPYSTGWGYYPSGGLGLILLIVLLVVAALATAKPSQHTIPGISLVEMDGTRCPQRVGKIAAALPPGICAFGEVETPCSIIPCGAAVSEHG
jgi:hypothetical protein